MEVAHAAKRVQKYAKDNPKDRCQVYALPITTYRKPLYSSKGRLVALPSCEHEWTCPHPVGANTVHQPADVLQRTLAWPVLRTAAPNAQLRYHDELFMRQVATVRRGVLLERYGKDAAAEGEG